MKTFSRGWGQFLGLAENFVENSIQMSSILFDESSPIFSQFYKTISEFGSPERINENAQEAGSLSGMQKKLRGSKYSESLAWLQTQGDKNRFFVGDTKGVTLEISACNHLSWLIAEAQQAIYKREPMPTRFIRVRSMKEQEGDDLVAWQYAMKIMGASSVQTLGTKGTMLDENGNPVNVHLNGGASIAGYFGGVGVPNGYAVAWLRELLYYYTNYGVDEVLCVNYGTYLLGLMLYKMGINVRMKLSVFMGIDNPFSVLNLLSLGKIYSRKDGSCGLAGLNFSNSVDTDTILKSDEIRRKFGFESSIRFEHHITEAYQGIVRQPYDRLQDLLEVAPLVKNLSAKHEGGVPTTEALRVHPSNILDYFLPVEDRREKNPELLRNYLDKHDSLVRTQKALATL